MVLKLITLFIILASIAGLSLYIYLVLHHLYVDTNKTANVLDDIESARIDAELSAYETTLNCYE